MASPVQCSHCGAPPLGNESRFCTFCGSALPTPEVQPGAQASRQDQLAARFAALESYPTYAELRAHEPDASRATMETYGPLIGGALFTAMGIFVTMGFAAFGGPMAIVPAIMVVFGIGIMISSIKNITHYNSAPLENKPATIIDERVKVSGGGGDSSSVTKYFATLQDSTGTRQEYRVPESIAGKIAPGDIGVAFLKGTHLIEYIVVPV